MTTDPTTAGTDFVKPQVHTQPFWDSVQAGEFVLEHCGQCGRYSHPPVGACRNCAGPVEFVPVDVHGVIYSASKMHYQAVPEAVRKAPYWVAIVDLNVQGGVRIVVPVVETADELIVPGVKVRIEIRELPGGGRRIPVAVVEASG